ncbi:hypothetical protein F1737_11430 [Methanoplanus sp. FWC-SCC4]|uniref:Uncharacterized protein n=1 Tax=Methanochimaera problematica TaxID=2609417 RepID=A0AA97FDV3_9EURY|nr:hypothetical protein [Methanoplanus sp. FWC-SCC4]WOF17242.1 hypothetical protein F1737_11430 [Methanoplanus sp. FWC-SCC4]
MKAGALAGLLNLLPVIIIILAFGAAFAQSGYDLQKIIFYDDSGDFGSSLGLLSATKADEGTFVFQEYRLSEDGTKLILPGTMKNSFDTELDVRMIKTSVNLGNEKIHLELEKPFLISPGLTADFVLFGAIPEDQMDNFLKSGFSGLSGSYGFSMTAKAKGVWIYSGSIDPGVIEDERRRYVI